MRHLHTEIRIAASRDRVWAVLSDFDDYPRWNPFIRRIEGELRTGERLGITLRPPGGSTMRFRPRVTVVEHGRELRWLGRMGLPGIFDGEHRLVIEDADEHAVRFVHEERFTGIAVPLFWRRISAQTGRGFEQMNIALKQVAEGATNA